MSDDRNRGKSFDVSVEIGGAIKQPADDDKEGEFALSILAVDENGESLPEESPDV